ncbi:unnamed protein product [Effrenium voratum]|nr:unnamed protein product [Effrenium voratum]
MAASASAAAGPPEKDADRMLRRVSAASAPSQTHMDQAVAQIFEICGVAPELDKDLRLREVLNQVLLEQEGHFRDRLLSQEWSYKAEKMNLKVEWMNRQAFLQGISLVERQTREKAQLEAEQCREELTALEALSRAREEAAGPAVLLGKTHLRAPADDKKPHEEADPDVPLPPPEVQRQVTPARCVWSLDSDSPGSELKVEEEPAPAFAVELPEVPESMAQPE